jgi:hypothetical protein
LKGPHVKISTQLAIGLAIAFSSSAVVAADGATEAPTATAETPKKVKKTCVREQVSGTNRIKRVCYAQGEEAVRAETAKGMDDVAAISATGN